MTSEEMHGIALQPGDTCPLIDAVIKGVSDSLNSVKYADRAEDIKELQDICSSVEWDLDGLEDKLEAIRTRVSEVRVWGQEWKDEAKRLQNELNQTEEEK
jgi:peptidoglycan hydrolase CwlO-like protein